MSDEERINLTNSLLELIKRELIFKKSWRIDRTKIALELLRPKIEANLIRIKQSGRLFKYTPVELRDTNGKLLYSFNLKEYLLKNSYIKETPQKKPKI